MPIDAEPLSAKALQAYLRKCCSEGRLLYRGHAKLRMSERLVTAFSKK